MSEIVCFLAVSVIFSYNAIVALLCLATMFIFAFGILLLSGVEFFSFVYLIVYTGAIVMIFLFIIMFYNHKIINVVQIKFTEFLLLVLTFYKALSILSSLFIKRNLEIMHHEYVIPNNNILNIVESDNLYNLLFFINEIKKFSFSLYNYFSKEFIIIGLLLLIVMVGLISILLNFYEYFIYVNENKKKN